MHKLYILSLYYISTVTIKKQNVTVYKCKISFFKSYADSRYVIDSLNIKWFHKYLWHRSINWIKVYSMMKRRYFSRWKFINLFEKRFHFIWLLRKKRDIFKMQPFKSNIIFPTKRLWMYNTNFSSRQLKAITDWKSIFN